VNTVIKHRDGGARGPHSDGFGFLEALKAGAPDWRADAGPVVVLGAGSGARRPSPLWPEQACPSCAWSNRTQATAIDLGVAFNAQGRNAASPSNAGRNATTLKDPRCWSTTTSLGMKGQPPLEIDLTQLPAWPPSMTWSMCARNRLAGRCRARGHRCIDGLGMLLHQGRLGFEAWFGRQVAVSAEQYKAVAGDLV